MLLAVSTLLACGQRSAPTTSSYNVLLISMDTVRQDMVGAYGRRPRYAPALTPTPRLDQLAAEGVRMADAIAPSSWTMPSHMSLFTGQPPLVHAMETETGTLSREFPTMAEVLKQRGYRTIGVYSAPYLSPHWGFGRGFDRYQPVYGQQVAETDAQWTQLQSRIDASAAAKDWKAYDALKTQQVAVTNELNRRSEQAVTSEGVTGAVVSSLRELAASPQPWFVFAHYFDPHCNYVPPPPYDTRFDPDYTGTATGAGCMTGAWVSESDPDHPGGIIRKIGDRDLDHVVALYQGEIGWTDSQVGVVLHALDELDLTRKTLVVVVSDHGEEFFDHGNLGHRQTLYEESIRVPLVMRLPGVLPAARVVPGPVSLTDVLPTVLDLVGLPPEPSVSGTTFVPLIHGQAEPVRRGLMERLVRMYEGDVQVDAGAHVPFRQVMVEDVYRMGPIKITRTRRWPQFPNGLAPDLNAVLQAEAGRQYQRETLVWTDVERFPQELPEQESDHFSDPAAHVALEAFRRDYATRVAQRKRDESPLPQNVRRGLQSLGYIEEDHGGPLYPEPDVVLPTP